MIRPWIAKKVVEFVGFEDEVRFLSLFPREAHVNSTFLQVVIEYAMGLLEDTKNKPHPDPKLMQVSPRLRHFRIGR